MTRMPRGPKGEKRLLICKFLLSHWAHEGFLLKAVRNVGASPSSRE
jgi:hypothetical protein